MQLGRGFDDQLFYFSGYDDAFVRDAPRLLRAGERCVDVGAQKGFFAMLLARCVGPTGAVLAIEPDPAACALLRAHVARNGLDRVRIADCVAGDGRADAVTFYTSRQLGWSSRFPNAMQTGAVTGEIRLPARTVDDLIAERLADVSGPVSFVKIDVEGSELHVLRGMTATLRAHAPIVWMEVNHASLRAANVTTADLEAELAPHGYRFFVAGGDITLLGRPRVRYTPVAHLEDAGHDDFDVVAVPPRHDERWALVPLGR
jgi:FkbM family methyltransferase